MEDAVREILGWLFLLAGSAFVVTGAFGLIRLPDFYSRIHAGGVTDTLGAWLIIIGLMFASGWSLATAKLLMLLVFLVLTSPLTSHALAKAAYLRGLEPRVGPDLVRKGDR